MTLEPHLCLVCHKPHAWCCEGIETCPDADTGAVGTFRVVACDLVPKDRVYLIGAPRGPHESEHDYARRCAMLTIVPDP